MSCERYWREGALLADRGEPDPHRETCEVCRREHEAREQIIRALPLVGSEAAGDPAWQARVWSRIAQLEAPRSRPARSWWYWGGGAVALGTAMLLWWMGGRREMPRGAAPMIELIPGGTMRSASLDSPSPGDRVRLSAHPGEEARIYRAGRLVLRCAPGQAQRGCSAGERGVVAEAVLDTGGEYQLVVVAATDVEPAGVLERDLEAVVTAGGDYKLTELVVR